MWNSQRSRLFRIYGVLFKLIKYIPATKTTSIAYEGVEVFVPSEFDFVTVDDDGELHGWECNEEPVLINGVYRHKKSNLQAYLQTYVKKWIGTFERDDNKKFIPQLWKV